MILFDTLTQSDKDKLANGQAFERPVGVFSRFIYSDFANEVDIGAMCYEYYFGRSGNKSISPFVENLLKIYPNNYTLVNESISEIIIIKYADKWRKIYGALTEQYNVIDTISLEEVKTGNNLDRVTYNSQIEDTITKQNSETVTYDSQVEDRISKQNSETKTYDTQVEDNGNTGSKETVTRSTNVQDSIYGFNSPVPVGDSSSVDTTTETTEGLPTDNVTNNIRTNTGTDTTQVSGTDTDVRTNTGTDTTQVNGTDTDTKIKSGTDTTNRSIDETISRSGRDRDAQKLIQDEINLRIENIFFDIVYKDLDNILTLQIYI